MTNKEVTPLDCELSMGCENCSYADQCYSDKENDND
jgi:hypothetical protein